MTESLRWSIGVQAVGGPALSTSGQLDVEAYDKIAVSVAAGATAAVSLGPGGTGMTCLLIVPATPDPDLSYAVGGNDVVLDAPVLLMGGAVALAGSPASLTFKNDTAAESQIQILIGRDATP